MDGDDMLIQYRINGNDYTVGEILGWKDKSEKCNESCHPYSLRPTYQVLEKQLEVYKARYEELQNRYLNGNEKYFSELCGLYFDDEPYPKEKA